MFGDERASAKEIIKFIFCVVSMSGLSGFGDNETGDARANVQSPHLLLKALVESTYLVTPNPHNKFEHNRSNRS